MMFIKPYAKLHLHGLGLLSAIFYLDILAYRALPDSFTKAKSFPRIHYLSTNLKLAKLLMLIAVTLVLTNFFVTYEPGKDAYIWSTGANVAYYLFSRITSALGWMMLAFYIILGYSKLG